MARHFTRLAWATLFFLGTTMVFWAMLQNQTAREFEHPWHRDVQVAAFIKADQRVFPQTTHKPRNKQIFKDGNFSLTLELSDFQHIRGGSAPYLRGPETDRLWPNKVESDDRLLAQMNHLPDRVDIVDPSQEKLILIYNGYPQGIPDGRKKFERDHCPVFNCRLTEDRTLFNESDAVVFQSGMYSVPTIGKRPGQVWIMYMLESPENLVELSNAHGLFNWTATYRRDSTLHTPYEKFVPFANISELPPPKRNYAEGKQDRVAWFVSNCYAANGRLHYAKELQKHIPLDIYGDCGPHKCYRNEPKRCNNLLKEKYKFYLAFENSNCVDYITEKFYWNGLYNDVVPIVMGARPEDYAAVAPPHSYIHVDDFESPRHLADYLYKLAANDSQYNEYFRWKGTGEFIDTKYWCRLCTMVHESQRPQRGAGVGVGGRLGMWYDDIEQWWHGPGVCARPRQGKRWSSWRNITVVEKSDSLLRYGPFPGS